ncbi:methyl-accepting chemotaxis protein [Massilia terrae]|uniref:Methyl-accepting chemotaxis protein n=1 Tax=Massilia terrae TaxID=1811224 RepID=A0ABT2CYM6_9BURK|nr:methyl-accepting chemotaxis protein [Massilia terrae]MCS0658280.1 methyl-accepting chemotaxis protein [Massilia terrae]
MTTSAANNPQAHFVRADKMFVPVLWALFLFTMALGFSFDSLALATLLGGAIAAVPTVLVLVAPGSVASRYAVGIALMLFCALNIQQTHGQIELHFGIFVLLAFLVCYQDWGVVIAAAGVVAVHHLSFNYLQQWGYPTICFAHPGLDRVLIHAAYVVVEAGVLSYLAVRMKHDSTAVVDSSAALQETLDTMRHTADKIAHGMQLITSASGDVASGNATVSSSATAQASSLEHATVAMKSLTDTVKQNADHAALANELVSSASSVALAGGDVVSNVVTTMASIRASSRKIEDIIGVIDGIAFQTNILALNAAVEAARAGEQGRGFAVVATEVRSLAHRSAQAAKEIKQLIGDSVGQVDAGSELVDKAGRTMEQIVQSVKQVAEIMAAISVASRDQRDGIETVNQTIVDVERTNRQTVELVEQSSHAAGTMHAHATSVAQIVNALRGDKAALPAP